MGGMCLTGCRVTHLFCVTVVSGNQQLAAYGFNRFRNLLNAVVQRFNRFNGCFHHAGVAHHIAIRIVTDDGVVFTALDRGHQFFGQLRRAHFWLEIVSGDFR